ncbi:MULTISPECIES: hypothetical protein [unclassified Ruegeria]|uniref:hypothetical protein n=1 Tax=unclassified Ruegeria TaxID=2625375 RepID=UPI001489022E|nr:MULTISPECIES: hypothetical protein [unclassified Ruegeria]
MKTKLLTIAFAMMACGANAAVQNYDCQLHSIEAQGWIPQRVILSVDTDGKQARAFDGHIRESNNLAGLEEFTPAKAKLKTTSKGEYRLTWKVRLSSNSSRRYRVNYIATLDPQTNQLGLRATFPMDGLSNRPSGEGPCKLIETSLF